MKFTNKFIIFILFILLIVSPTIAAKSYTITDYDINYTLNQNGIVDINESITYNLSGCFNELYIQRPPSLNIISSFGNCNTPNCEFIIKQANESITGDTELILKDVFCDQEVKANFNYSVINVIKEFEDGTQFFYKIYGDKTQKSPFVNINIFLPDDLNKTIYFLHTDGSDYTLIEDKKALNISKQTKPNELIEINLLMPKEWFSKENIEPYSKIVTKENIIQIEKKENTPSKRNKELNTGFKIIFLIIMYTLPFLILFIIWYFFGKEIKKKKLNYFYEYERELPSNHDPIQANYFLNGKLTSNWFATTIMLLVNKNKLELIKNGNKLIIIKKNNITEYDKIDKNIIKTYEFIIKKMKNNEIDVEQLKEEIKFSKEFFEIQLNLKKDYDKWFKDQKLINKTGFYLFLASIFLIIFQIFITPIFFIFSAKLAFLYLKNYKILIGLYVLVLLIIYLRTKTKYSSLVVIFSKWTKEGRLLNLKWSNFNKYITDFSEIKSHPPRAVILWDEYLIYATAFGTAKKVADTLKVINVNTKNLDAHIYFTITYTNSFRSYRSSSTSSSGGFGGGGFGGGHGGGGGGGGAGAR